MNKDEVVNDLLKENAVEMILDASQFLTEKNLNNIRIKEKIDELILVIFEN